jgi:hypothetical protein
MNLVKLLPIVFYFALTGCELVGPSVKVEAPKLIIGEDTHGKEIHCPPGQAKKGKC